MRATTCVCVDVDARKVDMLQAGEVPIHEPGLDVLVKRNSDAGRLRFTTDAREAVEHGQFQLIAVGTPPDEDGSADLRHVLAVARTIGEHMSEYKVVVTKSTVPVGTADKVREAVAASLAGARRGGRVRHGLEPGIPEGGRGDRRFHEARPGGRRHRQPARDGADARAL